MKKNITLIFILLSYFTLYSQTGINTPSPQGAFHVDAAGNNPKDGTAPNETEQLDDFVISKTGVVSIGTINPSPYSVLEIESNKGLRFPQLTTDQISILDAISSSDTDKKNGLILYNTTTNCINYWADTEWLELCKCTSVSGTPVISSPNPALTVGSASSFSVSGVNNAENYVWKVNNDIQTGQNGDTFTYTPSDTNPFTISVVAYGCNNSSTTEANSGPLTAKSKCLPVSGTPVISFPTPDLMVDNFSQFSVTEVSNAEKYVWKVNNDIQIGQNGDTFTYKPLDTKPFTISVVAYGCNNSSTTETISGSLTAMPNCLPVSGNLAISPQSISINTSTPQKFIATDVNNAKKYIWKLNGDIVQDSDLNYYNFNTITEGYYTLSVTAYGDCGSPISALTNATINVTFVCTEAGRFFKAGTNCTIYNFCTKMGDGSFVKQTYPCPDNSKFDYLKRICTQSAAPCPF